MSRRAFAGWGWELSDQEFAQAVAALGVMARGLPEPVRPSRTRRPVRPGAATSPRRRTVERYELLLSEIASESTATERALIWDLSPLGSTRAQRSMVLGRVPAGALAAAWSSASARWRPLEVHPVPWIDASWTFEMLAVASEAGVPYFPLPEPGGRLRWNWPLRVGFLSGSRWLREDLYRELGPTRTGLTEPEVGPSRCDILVIPVGVREAIDTLEQESAVPEATLALILDVGREPVDFDPVPVVAARLGAWGVAMTRIPTTRASWYRDLMTHLSHALPLLHCLRYAGGVQAMFAAPALAQSAPLVAAASALAVRMQRVEETVELAALPLPLPRGPWRCSGFGSLRG